MAVWNKKEPNTKGFVECDICGIGLGTFDFYQKHRNGGGHWEKVEGEKKLKWRGGELLLQYLDFNEKEELVWVSKVVKPKYTCPECREKYKA